MHIQGKGLVEKWTVGIRIRHSKHPFGTSFHTFLGFDLYGGGGTAGRAFGPELTDGPISEFLLP